VLHVLASCRCHSSGGSYADYLAFRWLWDKLHWWAVPVYLAFLALVAFVRGLFGAGDDC
jgi:hypothetical protein